MSEKIVSPNQFGSPSSSGHRSSEYACPSEKELEHVWLNTIRCHSACLGKYADPITTDDLKRILRTALQAQRAFGEASALSDDRTAVDASDAGSVNP